MKKIVDGWKDIRDIRARTGMETVPWKFNIKEYESEGRKTYDLGMTPV